MDIRLSSRRSSFALLCLLALLPVQAQEGTQLKLSEQTAVIILAVIAAVFILVTLTLLAMLCCVLSPSQCCEQCRQHSTIHPNITTVKTGKNFVEIPRRSAMSLKSSTPQLSGIFMRTSSEISSRSRNQTDSPMTIKNDSYRESDDIKSPGNPNVNERFGLARLSGESSVVLENTATEQETTDLGSDEDNSITCI